MTTPDLDLDASSLIGASFPKRIAERIVQLAASEGLGRCEWLRRLVLRHLEELDAEAGGALA